MIRRRSSASRPPPDKDFARYFSGGRARAALTLGAGAACAAGAATAGVARWRRRGDRDLAGKAVLVTGGSRGLGFLLARRFLQQGCRVAICGRDPETLERAVARLRVETGGDARGAVCDVGDAAQVAAMVDWAAEALGGIDVLVNNAGVIQVGPLETMDLAAFRRAMDVTYWGAVHTTLATLPHMRRVGGGRIVNITSIGAVVAVPHLIPYDAAKHAMLGFSEGLRAELARDGIAVTTVVPGLMRTGSPIHVEYRGQPEKEYAWFTLGDVLPVTAMSAERAADRIVRATRRRKGRITLTWQARMLRLAHTLAPGATGSALGVVNRVLPDANGRPSGEPDIAHGRALRGTLPAPAEWALDRAGWRANQ